MPYVRVGQENSGSIDLYYEDHGEGQPVILIHGYPLSGASWEKQTAALVEAGRRVIVYDRRGFGRSSLPFTGYDYDTFADDLHQLITKLSLSSFALVGFSMGSGEVARYIGKFGTAGITHAVFMGGVPPFLLKTPDNPDGVDPGVFEDIKANIRLDRYTFFDGFFQNFFNADKLLGSKVSQQVIDACKSVAYGASAEATLACVDSWLEDFRQDLSRVNIPALVLHGDADRIVPIEASGLRTSKIVPGARMAIIKDGPHAINWTHAEEVNAELLWFLQSRRAATH